MKVVEWNSSEKLRLLLLHKQGVGWPEKAEKLNEVYLDRPINFFNEKNCKEQFDRICNEACPKAIEPGEPSQGFKKDTVIDAWISHLKEQVRLSIDKTVELALVDLRGQTELLERLMNRKSRPPMDEMRAMLAKMKEEQKNYDRNPEKTERVESAYRTRVKQVFKEQRESEGNDDMPSSSTMPSSSLAISPTKFSNVALQPAFRSPSPLKSPITSPIRPLAEAIEEADAEMLDMMGEMEEEPEEEKEEEETQVDEEEEEETEEVEEQDEEMEDEPMEEPKLEVETPVASPPSSKPASISGKIDEEKSSTVSPRTAADRAIGNGGLEEELEEEDDEEEVVKEEPMEVDEKPEKEIVEEKTEETEKKVEEVEKPIVTRKSTRVSTSSMEMTPSTSGKEKKRKEPSPQSIESKEEEVQEKEKEEAKEGKEDGRVRRTSMRGRPPKTPSTPVAATVAVVPTPSTPTVGVPIGESTVEEKEEGGAKTRRSSRVEKVDEKKDDKKEEKRIEKKDEKEEEEEGGKKRITRRHSMLDKDGEKTEEKETKDEVTFVAPSVATRTRHHRGSEAVDEKEKEKSEEPTVPKTRSGNRLSLNTKASSDSPAPSEKKAAKRVEKKEDESEEKEIRGGKETSVALSERSCSGVGGKRDAEVLTELSFRHIMAPSTPVSPSKTRKGTERESPSTSLARKSSRVSSASSTSGKRDSLMVSVEVQTDDVAMNPAVEELTVQYNSNEQYFLPVHEIERGRGRPRKEKEKEKEIKTETDEEKPVSRRTRGGEVSEDEGGSRSGSFSQSEKGTPSRRKESKRDLMTVNLEVDDDTGRYWLANGATTVEPMEDKDATTGATGESAKKRGRAANTEVSGRRSIGQMDTMKQALFKACKDLDLHRHSSVFKANVPQKDAPDYYDCVHFTTCISKIKQEVLDDKIKDFVSLKRQFSIMFMNGAMYNSTAHDYWMYAVEMNKESYRPIRELMPEMMVEEEEVPKMTRGRRNNEPAFAKDAVLCDRDRSMTLDRYFKCESLEGDEADTPADDHRVLYTRSKVDTTRKRRI